jgi:hypothetical protein
MRPLGLVLVLVLVAAAAACTPEIVSRSYRCGPDATCPGDQVCNGPDNICVSGAAEPFACEPEITTEPDDSSTEAFDLGQLGCVSLASTLGNCMLDDDSGDWVKFQAPTGCDAVAIVRLTFPTAFEELGLELWDLDRDEKVGEDAPCEVLGEAGDDLRCLTSAVMPGTNYGVHILPTGEGDCDGTCGHNRYTVRLQMSAPR